MDILKACPSLRRIQRREKTIHQEQINEQGIPLFTSHDDHCLPHLVSRPFRPWYSPIWLPLLLSCAALCAPQSCPWECIPCIQQCPCTARLGDPAPPFCDVQLHPSFVCLPPPQFQYRFRCVCVSLSLPPSLLFFDFLSCFF